MTFETWLAEQHPEIRLSGAAAVLKLAGEGATVPFIARYRKEQTGNLDEVKIQQTLDAKERWDGLLARQAFIVEEIERQKKLTPELKEKILATFDAAVLEDLYLPYKRKRKSKATLAKEAGIEPLANWIWDCGHGLDKPLEGQTLDLWAYTFRNEELGYADLDAVLQGALDILTERVAETQDLRQLVRDAYFQKAHVLTKKGEKAKQHSKYEHYFDHHEAVTALLEPQHSHRYQAARRGWLEEELSLSIGAPPDDPDLETRLLGAFAAAACSVPDSPGAAILEKAARTALKAHVIPSIENEVHHALKDVADEVAIRVFAENVRQLLLASPFGSKAVLGIDPGVRTGCKVAVVDDTGRFLASTTFHLRTDEEKVKAKVLLGEMLTKAGLRAVAVGNGTAGRETDLFVREALKELGSEVPVVMVSEAGASVYSASAVAREELPDLDVTVRGAVSIARRLQDPLAELVKIDPKSIGVGQYQHDVSPTSLKKSLEHVVDSCVNQVGVNLNTASYHLLAHVSGVGPALARAIVEHRVQNGLFKARAQLLDVPRFSSKTFEQAAGFLRIPGGDHPLDNTGVHPERYPALEAAAARLGKTVADFLGSGVALLRAAAELKTELGDFTFDDVIKEIERPGRDPRDAFVPFSFREDIHEIADLKAGMVCPGIVTNVTNFGAFVDIGVHHDGLVHISRLAQRFVKDPREVVKPGQRVEVRVVEVDQEKTQISLSMKVEPRPRVKPERGKNPARRVTKGAETQGAARREPRREVRQQRERTDKATAPPPERSRPPQARPRLSTARPPVPARPQRPAFNNPFAVLAKLRGPAKS